MSGSVFHGNRIFICRGRPLGRGSALWGAGLGGWAEHVGAEVVAGDCAAGGLFDGDAPRGRDAIALLPLGYRRRPDAKGVGQRLLTADDLNGFRQRVVFVHVANLRPGLIFSQQVKPNHSLREH